MNDDAFGDQQSKGGQNMPDHTGGRPKAPVGSHSQLIAELAEKAEKTTFFGAPANSLSRVEMLACIGDLSDRFDASLKDSIRLAKIEAMCRRHNSPAVNTGAQSLAGAILRIIEDK